MSEAEEIAHLLRSPANGRRFMEALKRSFAAMAQDAQALSEVRDLEGTLGDGLEGDDYAKPVD